MRILYACTQRPGYGGAATETYEAIKWLRKLGHEVCGVFIVPEEDLGRCDPEGIGGIESRLWKTAVDPLVVPNAVITGADPTGIWHEMARRKAAGLPEVGLVPALPEIAWPAGDWDVAVGKNGYAPRLFWILKPGIPRVYLTSGIEAFASNGFGSELPPDGPDRLAFAAATHVVVHSTLDRKAYESKLASQELDKIVPGVVRTSALAARKPAGLPKALSDRHWDLCLAASTWDRQTKGPGVARGICFALRKKLRIVVCGEAFDMPGIDCLGLVPHERMLDVVGDSRVVVIPSLYDSSPNLYVEAVLSGCNIVVSPRVGNIEDHPPELLASNPSAALLVSRILAAVGLPDQMRYGAETPEDAARALSGCLERIVKEHHHGSV